MLLWTVSFKILSILSSNHFASLQTKKDNCIPRHCARVFSIMGMIDLNTFIVCNVSVGCRLHWFYWIFQAPCLICIPSLLGESAQGSGKSLAIYQKTSICFSFWGQVLGMFMLWIRLKPIYFNVFHINLDWYCKILYTFDYVIIWLAWVQASFSMTWTVNES